MRIVIPGGSGQVGGILGRHFHALGHDVTVIARHPQPAPWRTIPWNGSTPGAWGDLLNGVDVVINLAGRSVNCRYNAANRREISESRVATTRLIGEAISRAPHQPALWINASTATIYRHAMDRAMDEATGEIGGHEAGVPETWRFSIQVATAWEKAFFDAPAPRTRKIALRSSLTLSPDRGGVFDVLLGLVRRGLGGTAGTGAQFVSWIHDADFARAVEYLIAHDEFDGPVNVCSPNPLPNREFMRALREAWGTRVGLPAPAWLLEIGTFFMRTETELVLKSRRVIPGRLSRSGFQFQFPDWPAAARDLVRRWRT